MGGLTCTPWDGESRAVGSKAKEPSVRDGGGGGYAYFLELHGEKTGTNKY